MTDTIPSLRVRNVLVDVDDTLVSLRPGRSGDCFMPALAAVLARRRGLGSDEAEDCARSAFQPERECVTAAVARLGLDLAEFWREVVPRMAHHFMVHPDAANMLRCLHGRGFRLFPATSNSGFTILTKLAAGGLAKDMATPYLARLLGGAEVHPQGKRGPDFYRALLRILALRPDETVMIGDNPIADAQFPREAGIEKVILVRRDMTAEWARSPEGAVCVRSLMLAPQMLGMST